jgi:hypothetical protein
MSADKHNDSQAVEGLKTERLPDWLVLVREHVESLKFGTVQITVHDSRVMEVVRSEKVRVSKNQTNWFALSNNHNGRLTGPPEVSNEKI